MRFVNWCLNLIIHLFLLTCLLISAGAQQNGNAPAIRQSTGDLNFFPASLQSGNMVVGYYCWEDGGVPVAMTSCTDANGIVPSITVGSMNYNSDCTGNPFDTYCAGQAFWGTATSSGTPNISCSGHFPRQLIWHAIEFSGPAITFDAQNTASTSTANPSVNVTSSAQNDVVVGYACTSPLYVTVPPITSNAASHTKSSDIQSDAHWFGAGAAGTQTSSWVAPIAEAFVMNATAFKPSAISVSASTMPLAMANTPYFACLQGWGGSGAYTWSVTGGSLPTGMSLATTASCPGTNSTINGTPTVPGVSSATFQVSDGTHTATRVLPITVAVSANSISGLSCSGFSTNPSTASVTGVKIGDPIYIFALGSDRHGYTHHQLPASAYTDNCTNSYYLWPSPIAGGNAGDLEVYSTTSTCSGTITPGYVGAGGSPLAGAVCTVPGAQALMDSPVINHNAPGAVASPTTLSATITTPLANGLVFAIGTMDCEATGGDSCTMTATTASAGWNLATTVTGFGGVPFSVYYQLAPTATSYSATFTYTDATRPDLTYDTPRLTEVFVRQGGPLFTIPTGEKIRRYVN